MVSDTKAVKSVGEFWTCCKLAMNGWAPALTRDGLERTDILAERSHAPFDVTQISVQVKTSRNERWALNPAKIGSQRSLYEWFVLVGWNENEQTLSSYIVPRNHVSAGAWLGHMRWLIPLLSEIEIAGLNKPVWMFRFSAITKTDGIYC